MGKKGWKWGKKERTLSLLDRPILSSSPYNAGRTAAIVSGSIGKQLPLEQDPCYNVPSSSPLDDQSRKVYIYLLLLLLFGPYALRAASGCCVCLTKIGTVREVASFSLRALHKQEINHALFLLVCLSLSLLLPGCLPLLYRLPCIAGCIHNSWHPPRRLTAITHLLLHSVRRDDVIARPTTNLLSAMYC